MNALIIWMALVLLACTICIVVIVAIRKPMSELLKANSYISPARKFYLRSFSLIIFLATLGVVVGVGKPCAEQSKCLMEGVWWITEGLIPVFWSVMLSLGGYALLLTILFAVLGRYHDE